MCSFAKGAANKTELFETTKIFIKKIIKKIHI